MHLTFWQPIPSFHQEGLLNALAAASWVDSVELRYEQEVPTEDQIGGWRLPIWEGVDARRIDAKECPEDSPERVHIFTGFYTHPLVWRIFDRLPNPRQSRCFALTEAPALYGWRGWLRLLKYHYLACKMGSQLDGLMAIGGKAEKFYGKLLSDAVPVHPFAYYDLSSAAFPKIEELRPSGALRLLYVGRLIHLKGLDRLFRSLAALPENTAEWELTILGSGPEGVHLRALASQLGIGARLTWVPAVSVAEVGHYYNNSDVLVQPSRGDGWGMTVIEGLRHGCEVIATDACGAAVAVDTNKRLQSDWHSWVPVLEQVIRQGPQSVEQRQDCQRRAEAFSSEAGVEALRRILE